ncbi:phage holin family protein [Zeimonas arvi]|uniref:Phage holin family protein n=1 Tax=Zeimonas arvi TaxID=2498847 RepID=A0A5C8NWJ4_9BURK|nr:phage holin family protein [Zeimonas arvi]TXL65513.1 phage holin family protein [Zeimonas arvi]
MGILIGWAVNAASLLLLAWLIPAVQVAGFGAALVVALVLGLLNAVIRPVLIVLTLPVNLLTLGLFTFVINGFLFWFAARILEGFSVNSFGWAILAAILYSLISWAVSSVLVGGRR